MKEEASPNIRLSSSSQKFFPRGNSAPISPPIENGDKNAISSFSNKLFASTVALAAIIPSPPTPLRDVLSSEHDIWFAAVSAPPTDPMSPYRRRVPRPRPILPALPFLREFKPRELDEWKLARVGRLFERSELRLAYVGRCFDMITARNLSPLEQRIAYAEAVQALAFENRLAKLAEDPSVDFSDLEQDRQHHGQRIGYAICKRFLREMSQYRLLRLLTFKWLSPTHCTRAVFSALNLVEQENSWIIARAKTLDYMRDSRNSIEDRRAAFCQYLVIHYLIPVTSTSTHPIDFAKLLCSVADEESQIAHALHAKTAGCKGIKRPISPLARDAPKQAVKAV